MSSTPNDDPMGPEYWERFAQRDKQTEVERNRRDSLYGGCDPATLGWRRPTAGDWRDELTQQHGPPSAQDYAWAEQELGLRQPDPEQDPQ